MQEGQQALLATTLYEYNVDLCCLSEVCLPDAGSCNLKVPKQNETFTLYYIRAPRDIGRQGQHGVGFTLSKRISTAVIEFKPINYRLAKISIAARPANLFVIAAYAPTNSGSDNDNDAFYSALSCEIEQVPANDYLVVAGDFTGY